MITKLKSQDIVLLLKLLANPDRLEWFQAQLAIHLCVSVSTINASLKRLSLAGLVRLGKTEKLYHPVSAACREFLILGVKYFFPVKLGELTCGIPTSYAAPVLKGYTIGEDPIPVWPYVEGKQRGMSFEPLYPSVPKSVSLFPDPKFYDLLCLIDVLRPGRVEECMYASKILKERLSL